MPKKVDKSAEEKAKRTKERIEARANKRNMAAVLLRCGYTGTEVTAATGLRRNVVFDIKNGKDPGTAEFVRGLKEIEDAQWTFVTSMCLQTLMEHPEKLNNAQARDLVTMAAIAKDKRDGLEVNITHTVEMDMTNAELLAQAKESAERISDFEQRLRQVEESAGADFSAAVDAEVETLSLETREP